MMQKTDLERKNVCCSRALKKTHYVTLEDHEYDGQQTLIWALYSKYLSCRYDQSPKFFPLPRVI
ncbi:hypothetical protein CO661_28125 [Sinorhizobium fredii]|uniref:Uncharacterized protein n=1 Tax=Rhizobium fredii TaxID=380 RepID=A0A2A6LQF5_RHIFR|nr:hypothetical protein CO661_28125 [Sinorhizobium fredii]